LATGIFTQARLEYQWLFNTLSRPDGDVRPHAGGALAKYRHGR
jgi:hypothetical protein